MTATAEAGNRELVLERLLDAPRAALWRCWTDPGLIKQWFVPKPWTIARADMDVRPGGSSLIVMKSPEGEEMPNAGVYLEVVEGERLVFTDAYTRAWEPAEKLFFTGIITFAARPAKPVMSRGRGIGPSRTARSTKRWVFTRVGASAPTSSRPWRGRCEADGCFRSSRSGSGCHRIFAPAGTK